jgi:hypothetical protein
MIMGSLLLERYQRHDHVPAGPDGLVGAAGDNGGVSNTAVSELAWGALASPVGEMSVACTAAGVARVRFGAPPTPAARPGRGTRPAERVSGAPGEAWPVTQPWRSPSDGVPATSGAA